MSSTIFWFSILECIFIFLYTVCILFTEIICWLQVISDENFSVSSLLDIPLCESIHLIIYIRNLMPLKWSRAKVNRALPKEHTGHSKHSLPTTQEMILHMNITRWSTPKSDSLQPKMEKLYTVSKNKTWNWLWPRLSASYCKFQA